MSRRLHKLLAFCMVMLYLSVVHRLHPSFHGLVPTRFPIQRLPRKSITQFLAQSKLAEAFISIDKQPPTTEGLEAPPRTLSPRSVCHRRSFSMIEILMERSQITDTNPFAQPRLTNGRITSPYNVLFSSRVSCLNCRFSAVGKSEDRFSTIVVDLSMICGRISSPPIESGLN